MAEPVYLTGLGVVCPIGRDVAAFTAALRAGQSGITARPAGPRPGTLLAPAPELDLAAALGELGLCPAVRRHALRVTCRSPGPVRAALAAAAQAWQQARLAERGLPGDRIGVVVGGHNLTIADTLSRYEAYLREPAYLPARHALQVQDTDHVATISHALGITGEGCTIGASSASGNAALIQAARLIRLGAVDACLAVGAMVKLTPMECDALVKLGALAQAAPGGGLPPDAGPFGRRRTGFVPGEGTAAVVLESAASVTAPGAASPLAELAGWAQALDGNSLADPRPGGEARVMTAAMDRAGLVPGQLGYVSAHATGTPAGDDAELAALRAALPGARPWLNATKALTGHCLSAAGLIEAVAAVLQLRHGFVHRGPLLSHPVDTQCRLAGPRAEPASVRYALSNSFGFGGFNSCLVLRRC
ncbi:MAG TPA: beta-ketoacyl synthase N-terminal-like domain-containing protein [Streptosporangiaceae bacterium]